MIPTSLTYTKTDSVLKRISLTLGYLTTIILFVVLIGSGIAQAYAHFAKTEKLYSLEVDLNTKFAILEDRLAFSIAEQKESAFRTRAMEMKAKHGTPENMPQETREIYEYWNSEAEKYKDKMKKLDTPNEVPQ